MTRLVWIGSLLLAGCTTVPTQEAPGKQLCNADGLQRFIGQAATADLGAELLRTSGAGILRWVPPNSAITTDARTDRLTIYIDALNRIERFDCI